MTSAATDLVTLRDLLRYAVSRFGEAGIAYGQGTTNPLDEAAFLLLWSLHLPIDRLDPFLDARLLLVERERALALIEERIATRKPAAYLTHEAWIGPYRFYVDERVIVPRSYLGELMNGGLEGVIGDPSEVARVLDLCTGSGCLAIVAAHAFPSAHIDAVDISGDALAVAERNVAEHGLADRVRLLQGDLLQPVAGDTYDLILSNPPYVSAASMAAFAPEFSAEPVLAHSGGTDGLDLVRRILADAGAHLQPEGGLLMEVGTGRALLEAEHPELSFLWLDTTESEGEVLWLPGEALQRDGSPGRRSRQRRR